MKFNSKYGKGYYEFWSDMVDMFVEYVLEIELSYEMGFDVEKIICSGIFCFVD